MKTYRSKHPIEAMRWTDTAANREAFAAWFERHDAMFVTRGPEVVLPDFDDVTVTLADEGAWIVCSDGDFIAMGDAMFTHLYEEVA